MSDLIDTTVLMLTQRTDDMLGRVVALEGAKVPMLEAGLARAVDEIREVKGRLDKLLTELEKARGNERREASGATDRPVALLLGFTHRQFVIISFFGTVIFVGVVALFLTGNSEGLTELAKALAEIFK